MKKLYASILLAVCLSGSGCTSVAINTPSTGLSAIARSIGGKVSTQQGQLVMVLPSDHLFRPGGTRLTPHSYKLLTHLADTLMRDYPHAMIKVAGHTDSSGSPQRNRSISITRARAVAGYLRYRGIHRDQLEASGFGDTRPVTKNDTPAERAENRRIEIYIS